MSTLTTVLKLIKHEDNDNVRQGETIDASANMDIIDALFDPATGHRHGGSGEDGRKVLATDLDPTGGSALQLLRVKSDESGLEWAKPGHDSLTVPACRVYHNANQSIADDTYTTLAFNSERFDTDTIHDTVTNNERLTCKTAGKYLIAVNLLFASNNTGGRTVALILNGATNIGRQSCAADPAQETGVSVSTVYDLAVGDYITVMAYQSSGGALNVVAAGNQSPEFMMVRIA
jgi:hypothetical protein